MGLIKKFEKSGKRALAAFLSFFVRIKKITPEELSRISVKKLLVIRQHNQMGDMLLAVPAFRGLRRRFSDASISLISAPINAEVMINNPFVDEVLVYAKKEHSKSLVQLLRFIHDLRSRRFDVVIVLSTVSFSITSMLLGFVSGARIRIGSTSRPFGHDLSSRFYHLELPLPSQHDLQKMHESEHNLYPLAAIGVAEHDLSSLLVSTPEEQRACDGFVSAVCAEGCRFIVIHPGAGKKQNIWPARHFAEVANRLASRFSLEIVAVRGPVDGPAMDEFLRHCGRTAAVVSCPSVGFLGALMKRAVCTICNDTGIMHIAGAVGAGCVALFGPTEPSRWKPAGEHVTAVRARDMNVSSIDPDEVFTLVEKIVSSLSGNELDL
jgi:ADP-heptose:LPS heptosyltransferase